MTLLALATPELLTAVVPRRLPGELWGLASGWKDKELPDGMFEGDLKRDKDASLRVHGVLSASLSTSIPARSFPSFSEPSESLSVLLSESAEHVNGALLRI